jgi:ribonuclease BN (tRNA processing enzyme)
MDPLSAATKLSFTARATRGRKSAVTANGRSVMVPTAHLNGRLNITLSLQLGAAHLLIDIGAGCQLGIRRAQLELPSAVLLTHSHSDHLNQMKLDTLLRDSQLTRRPKPLLVASERTWQDISNFHQSRLEFFKIEAGQEITLPGSHKSCQTRTSADICIWKQGAQSGRRDPPENRLST